LELLQLQKSIQRATNLKINKAGLSQRHSEQGRLRPQIANDQLAIIGQHRKHANKGVAKND
jgi:hypothetical protein